MRNFKRFEEVVVDLGNPVVFIGPNNSGKTSAMQALALWDLGLRRWCEKRKGKSAPGKRPGVTINRRDLLAAPVPDAKHLWRDLHTRDVRNVGGQQRTSNIRIDLIVEGVSGEESWTCGLEFDYANAESLHCRPLRQSDDQLTERMPVPSAALATTLAFLPPMSGLMAAETRLDLGAVNVRIGEGRTAEVLRNLCFRIQEESPSQWHLLVNHIKSLFGSELLAPVYIAERGEIVMSYRERGVTFDLSAAGRGLQQTLLLLAYLYANPGAVMLLDEPDAHLEILRQRQIYHLLRQVSGECRCQIIAASHSEILLNEAAGQDTVIAFVGLPHRLDNQGSQILKALKDIGYEDYYQSEQTGWVLYLEGSTDLSVLRALARRLGHERAMEVLERPFVHYVGNQPTAVQNHYHGLREALPELHGVALFDRLEQGPVDLSPAECLIWSRREIENYLCSPATLNAYAQSSASKDTAGPLFAPTEAEKRLLAMSEAMEEISSALARLGKESPWGTELKVSDEFLEPLFKRYFEKLGLPNLARKKSFYELAEFVPEHEIDPEILEKLDAIVMVAESARNSGQGV